MGTTKNKESSAHQLLQTITHRHLVLRRANCRLQAARELGVIEAG